MYIIEPETQKYVLYSDDVLRNPGLVQKEIFYDLVMGLMSGYDYDFDSDIERWDDESEFFGRPGWRFSSGAIGLRKGAPKDVADNWKGYLRSRWRRGGMTEEEIVELEKKQHLCYDNRMAAGGEISI
ncbi:MAG: hypothetical protein FWG41_06445, partial [Methanomassiliicoccaceae archaeon]|nr:hypothetical protein [Methanomassiliicoccaceae archaeon]